MTIRRETSGRSAAVAGAAAAAAVHRAACGLPLLLFLAACNPGKGMTAYVGGNLWDGTGGPPVMNAVVVVDSTGHIERAGGLKVPRGAVEVRVDGKWIIPGLIDAHAHAEPWTLSRFLAYGVTSVRDLGGRQDSIVALRDQVSSGGILGPRLYISGAMIDRRPATWPTATAVTTALQARRAVDARTLLNAAQVKVYTKIDSRLLAPIMDEATSVGMPVAGHLGKVDAVTAARMGIASLEHLSGVVEASVRSPAGLFRAHDDFFRGWNLVEREWARADSARLQRTAQLLKRANVSLVPTLALHQVWAHLQDSAYLVTLDLSGVPQSVQHAWNVPDLIARARLRRADYSAFRASRRVQDRFLRMYHRLGGPIAAGSDAPNQLLAPGASLHDEMALLVGAGLAPGDALLAATREGERLLRTDTVGVVRAGAVADFLILSASPLENIKNTRSIEAVVFHGVYRTADQLRALWNQ